MIGRCINGNCKGFLRQNVIGDLEGNIEKEFFKCEKCGTSYERCKKCDGEGFEQTENGIFDCEDCQGTGLTY